MSRFPVAFSTNICTAFAFWKFGSWRVVSCWGTVSGWHWLFYCWLPWLILLGPIVLIAKFNQREVVTDVQVCFSACTNDIILNTKGLRVSPFIFFMPPIKTRVNFSWHGLRISENTYFWILNEVMLRTNVLTCSGCTSKAEKLLFFNFWRIFLVLSNVLLLGLQGYNWAKFWDSWVFHFAIPS